MKIRPLLLVTILLATGAAAADFETHWRDGKAEISGYRLTVSRYGAPRSGQAVLIYVTEPFSESKRVKLDDPARQPGDATEVLKLNLIRQFQTGIYDYHTMVSVFARTRDFSPLKISFSSAEWCGHAFEELLFRPGRVEGRTISYFEGESGSRQLDAPAGGVAEDNLWILLRGLRGAFLPPGESRTLPLLGGLFRGRLAHQPATWQPATIMRAKDPVTIKVPAGEFATWVYTVAMGGGRTGTFHIEAAHPQRIVRWEFAPDVRAELTGTVREQYWQLNRIGDEDWLKKLGLNVPAQRGN